LRIVRRDGIRTAPLRRQQQRQHSRTRKQKSAMPPELAPHLPLIVAAAASLFIGWLITWLAASAAKSALMERLKAEERRNTETEARLAHAEAESERIETQAQTYRNQLAETNSRLEAERKAAEEKQALLERAEAKLSDTFKALSADALKGASEQFLHLAKSTLASQTEEAKGEIEKRKTAIETLVKPVADSLGKFELRIGEIEKLREGAYSELKEQVRALGEGQLGLQRETASLVKALRQPTGRGQWGEMQLRRVVELAGMQEHCDFTLQTSSTTDEGKRLRPDMVVKLPGGKTIVVDSKTPMDAYLNALETSDEAERERFLTQHAAQVRTHIQQLSSKKYTDQFEDTPEFTVLFLPSESFFSAALHSDPGLIERGVDHGVILATPTTLIALLKAVAYGWRQEALALNAKEISALGRTMHERLGKLAEHFSKLGNSLNAAVENYNKAIGSYETRVMSTARKFEELKAAPEGTTLPDLEAIDKTTRPLLVNPLIDIEAKDDFAFVPEKETASKNAANDLRSAFGDF
jgi:DNA recombination protein RmuC